jgi:hypothetical protein
MSSTSDIAAKYAEARARGLDLGAKVGSERDEVASGRVQIYEHGRIYWHAQVGCHEVHGAILTEYLRSGGPGVAPGGSQRPLGFPTSDEERTADDLAQVSRFEWGSIHWSYGAGAVGVYGAHFPVWRGGRIALGYPITETLSGPIGGQVTFCQFGCLISNEGRSPRILRGGAAPLGRPDIVALDAWNRRGWTVTLNGREWDYIRRKDRRYFTNLWKDRLVLQEVRASGRARARVPLDVIVAEVKPFGSDGMVSVTMDIALAAGSRLSHRMLYDLAYVRPDGTSVTMFPHCVYAREHWNSLGAMHATDWHAAQRADTLHGLLSGEALANYNNWNEAIRDTIKYANKLYDAGILDLIIATGDLIDYQYETSQDPDGNSLGNALFLERLLMATVASPTGRIVEELRVPIYMVLGNHDYRENAYGLFFDVDLPGEDNRQRRYQPFNLTENEGLRLVGGSVPEISSGKALSLANDTSLPRHFNNRLLGNGGTTGSLDDGPSYIVNLGPHRLVMLDSGRDAGLPLTKWEVVKAQFLNRGDEDQYSLLASAPNQVGVHLGHLELVKRALEQASDGVVIIGIHGPPINIGRSDYADYLRESTHATANERDIAGSLIRADLDAFIVAGTVMSGGIVADWPKALGLCRQEHPGWLRTLGQTHFAEGSVDDLLDEQGASKGRVSDFLKLCAGVGSARAADVVLCGHGHEHVDYRIRWDEAKKHFRFYTDFYTQNVDSYYDFVKASWGPLTTWVRPRIRAGAQANDQPREINDHRWEGREFDVEVPPYATPLNSTKNRRQWWNVHRPLICQTAAVGPMPNQRREAGKSRPQLTFQGFRVLTIRDGTIFKIVTIRMEDLRAANFELAWEATAFDDRPGGPVGGPIDGPIKVDDDPGPVKSQIGPRLDSMARTRPAD